MSEDRSPVRATMFSRARTHLGARLRAQLHCVWRGAAGGLFGNTACRHTLHAKRSCQRPPSLLARYRPSIIPLRLLGPAGNLRSALSLRSSSLLDACPNGVWARGQTRESCHTPTVPGHRPASQAPFSLGSRGMNGVYKHVDILWRTSKTQPWIHPHRVESEFGPILELLVATLLRT